MTKIKCSLLKIALSLFTVTGIMADGFAQNVVTDSVQAGAENAVVYNKSGMGASIIIVFAVLIIILLAFKYFGKIMAGNDHKTVQTEIKPEVAAAPKTDIEGEVHAAIAMALYLYSNELHDQENPVITMIKVSRTYSPWSSKIYGLRKSPR
jgi:Na+-transporting methylmalonyl-CoA/oxaloacetate decarboxylase gamma subunit